jgi:phospholipid N-methyltransferase
VSNPITSNGRLLEPLPHGPDKPQLKPGSLTTLEKVVQQMLHLQTFVSEAVRLNIQSGAIATTCDRVSDDVIAAMPDGIERFADVGYGTGPLVRALLRSGKLASDGRVAAIEPNDAFARFGAKTVRDDRVRIYQAYGQDLPHLTDKIFGEGKKAQVLTVTTPMTCWDEKEQVELFQAIDASVEDGGLVILAIFNEIHGLFEQVFRKKPTVREVKGQRLPPWPYVVQSIRKGEYTASVA